MPWRGAARLLSGRRRDAFLSFYGPLSLLFLLALWAVGIVFSFGLLQWAAGSAMTVVGGGATGFWSDVYMSGTTFFTLGLGDVVPRTVIAKALTVVEAGTGFAFLAAVIGYFPVIYQAFSRREVAISLLDARAGSPPTAGELLWRYRWDKSGDALAELLQDWERWAADVLESHLSYPPLAYFRSQHYNQSWLGALTTILDSGASGAQRLAELRRMYEPYVAELARYLAVALPPWLRDVERPDNWQTSRWERPLRPPRRTPPRVDEDHF